MQGGIGRGQVAIADYIGWLSLKRGNFDRQDGVMADLKVLNMGTALLEIELAAASVAVYTVILWFVLSF